MKRATGGAARRVRSAWAGLLLAAVLLPAVAGVPAAVLVTGQSQIAFVTRQMGVPVEGRFRQFDAHIAFDPRHPEGGTVELQIATASAAFGSPQSDPELPKATWFDAARFPQAVFHGKSIRATGPGQFEVQGTLTLKGQARELRVPVTIAQSGGTSVATGSFTIRRLDYRIGDGDWTDTSMVADEVLVRFSLTLTGLGPLP